MFGQGKSVSAFSKTYFFSCLFIMTIFHKNDYQWLPVSHNICYNGVNKSHHALIGDLHAVWLIRDVYFLWTSITFDISLEFWIIFKFYFLILPQTYNDDKEDEFLNYMQWINRWQNNDTFLNIYKLKVQIELTRRVHFAETLGLVLHPKIWRKPYWK